jgi:hypothetical protein
MFMVTKSSHDTEAKSHITHHSKNSPDIGLPLHFGGCTAFDLTPQSGKARHIQRQRRVVRRVGVGWHE